MGSNPGRSCVAQYVSMAELGLLAGLGLEEVYLEIECMRRYETDMLSGFLCDCDDVVLSPSCFHASRLASTRPVWITGLRRVWCAGRKYDSGLDGY